MQNITTEQRNPRSTNIDSLSPRQLVELINAEDALVAAAVGAEREPLAEAVELVASVLGAGHRLFYIGAGTSGRLGVLDASECPPTFSTAPSMVVGIIAGGERALTQAIEGAEDDGDQGAKDLAGAHFTKDDVLVGIATSGRTPYVLGAVSYAKKLGAKTIGVTCNQNSELHSLCDITIAPIVGPEVLSGSTRLKAGTATKLVLNTLTTGAMILIGKTYGNLMVDLRASNKKLIIRSKRIVCEVTGVTEAEAAEQLANCNGEVKTAIVCIVRDVTPEDARKILRNAGEKLRRALDPDCNS